MPKRKQDFNEESKKPSKRAVNNSGSNSMNVEMPDGAQNSQNEKTTYQQSCENVEDAFILAVKYNQLDNLLQGRNREKKQAERLKGSSIESQYFDVEVNPFRDAPGYLALELVAHEYDNEAAQYKLPDKLAGPMRSMQNFTSVYVKSGEEHVGLRCELQASIQNEKERRSYERNNSKVWYNLRPEDNFNNLVEIGNATKKTFNDRSAERFTELHNAVLDAANDVKTSADLSEPFFTQDEATKLRNGSDELISEAKANIIKEIYDPSFDQIVARMNNSENYPWRKGKHSFEQAFEKGVPAPSVRAPERTSNFVAESVKYSSTEFENDGFVKAAIEATQNAESERKRYAERTTGRFANIYKEEEERFSKMPKGMTATPHSISASGKSDPTDFDKYDASDFDDGDFVNAAIEAAHKAEIEHSKQKDNSREVNDTPTQNNSTNEKSNQNEALFNERSRDRSEGRGL